MQIDVPDRLIGGLKEGMLLPAKIESKDIHMQVQIDKIYPVADLQKHTVKVELNLPLYVPAAPGMYAEVSVPNTLSKKKPNPIIPKTALIWRLDNIGSEKFQDVCIDDKPEFSRLISFAEIVYGLASTRPKYDSWFIGELDFVPHSKNKLELTSYRQDGSKSKIPVKPYSVEISRETPKTDMLIDQEIPTIDPGLQAATAAYYQDITIEDNAALDNKDKFKTRTIRFYPFK